MEKKPAEGGMPAMARTPSHGPEGDGNALAQAAHDAHVLLAAESAWMTEPAARKSSALKKAWVMRWKMAAEYAPTPQARNM